MVSFLPYPSVPADHHRTAILQQEPARLYEPQKPYPFHLTYPTDRHADFLKHLKMSLQQNPDDGLDFHASPSKIYPAGLTCYLTPGSIPET